MNKLIVLLILLTLSMNSISQRTPKLKKVSIGSTMIVGRECDCAFEPTAGNKNVTSFGPFIAFQLALTKRLRFETSVMKFSRDYQTAFVDDKYLHNSNIYSLVETIKKTKIVTFRLELGFAFKIKTVEIVPSMGLALFKRDLYSTLLTYYSFHREQLESLDRFPQTPPISTAQEENFRSANWKGFCADLGLTSYINITMNWRLKLSVFRKRTYNWIYGKPYPSKPYLLETSLGLSYEFSSLRRKNKSTEMK